MNLQLGFLAGILAMLSWGTSDFFVAQASRKVGPFKSSFWAYIIAFLLGTLYIFLFPQFIKLSFWGILIIAMVGFLQAIGLLFFYRSMEIGLVGIAGPVASSYSWIVIILSALFLKESLNNLQIISLVTIFIGLVLVSVDIKQIKNTKNLILNTGVKESFLSTLFWGLSYFLLALVVKEEGWFLPTYLLMFFICLFLLLYGLSKKENFNFQDNAARKAIIADGVLTIIGYIALGVGLTNQMASIVVPISTTFPLVTILLARIFFKEKLAWNQIVGIVGIIGGLVLLGL